MTHRQFLEYLDSLIGIHITFPKEGDNEVLSALEAVKSNAMAYSLTEEIKRLDIENHDNLEELRDVMSDTLFKIEQRLSFLGK